MPVSLHSRDPLIPVNIRRSLALVTLGAFLGQLAPAAEPESARARLAESARAVQEATAQKPFPFQDAGVYDVVSPRTVAGAGFLVQADGKTYAVTARHPHPTVLPSRFERRDQSLPLGRLVRDTDDILCFAVENSTLPMFTLIRPAGVLLRKGDPVTLIGHDATYAGRLNGIGLGMDELLLPGEPVTETVGFTVPGEPDFTGNSGAPVVLNKTGEVLGVLLKAVGVGRETMLEFAPLSFPAPFAPKPLRTPPSVFSFVPRGQAPGIVESAAAGAFPPELLEATLGMPMDALRQKRPHLSTKAQPHLYGQGFVEWLGKRNGSEYLFHEATFIAARGTLNRLEMLGYGWTTNVSASRIESLFDWFFETLGPPARALELTTKDGRPGHGAISCSWSNASTILMLAAQATGKQYNPRPWVSLDLRVQPAGGREFNPPKATLLPRDLPTLRRKLRSFLRVTAELPSGPK